MGEGRVLQVMGPSTGGIRRVVESLAHELTARGWEVDVAPLSGRLPPADLVHAHGLKAGWRCVGRHPLVTTVHNVVLTRSPLRRVLERRVPGDRLLLTSTDMAERFRGRRVEVVPPAATMPVPSRTPDEVRAGYGIADDERLLVTVARLHPQKDLPTLFEAVRDLPRTRLVLVGEGPDEAALRRTAPPNVVFAGPRPSAADELDAADVVVISSRWESGPLVLFEALALGKPVASTAVGAAPDLLPRTAPVGDAAALAALIDDPPCAPPRAYGPAAMTDAVEAVYRQLLGR